MKRGVVCVREYSHGVNAQSFLDYMSYGIPKTDKACLSADILRIVAPGTGICFPSDVTPERDGARKSILEDYLGYDWP